MVGSGNTTKVEWLVVGIPISLKSEVNATWSDAGSAENHSPGSPPFLETLHRARKEAGFRTVLHKTKYTVIYEQMGGPQINCKSANWQT